MQIDDMTCLWVIKISLTANVHMILHKYVNKFTPNTYLVVSLFQSRDLRLITLTNWNYPTYLWQNFILIYLMKVIRMLSLLQQIFVLFFSFSYKTNDISILDNHVESHGWFRKVVLFWISYLSTIISCVQFYIII